MCLLIGKIATKLDKRKTLGLQLRHSKIVIDFVQKCGIGELDNH